MLLNEFTESTKMGMQELVGWEVKVKLKSQDFHKSDKNHTIEVSKDKGKSIKNAENIARYAVFVELKRKFNLPGTVPSLIKKYGKGIEFETSELYKEKDI